MTTVSPTLLAMANRLRPAPIPSVGNLAAMPDLSPERIAIAAIVRQQNQAFADFRRGLA